MAKKSKKVRTQIVHKEASQPISFNLSERKQDFIFIALITILLVYLFKPLVFDGLSPQGVDVIAGKGKSHQIAEYSKKSGESALWNPAIFAGMPKYHDISPKTFSFDTILIYLGIFFSQVFIFYLVGAIGLYIFLRYLKMKPIIALIAALFFILIPHYKSLWVEGHFRKFRAVMFLPWVLLSFRYFIDKKTILSASFFAVAFAMVVRTGHYQIVFYCAMMVFAIGVYPFVKMLINKQYNGFMKMTVLLTCAVTLGILSAAQPLFLAKEYLPYSKRGKTTIDINQEKSAPDENKATGVNIQYATQWSTHPGELLTWFVPRVFGGMSGEKYDGKDIQLKRQLKNQALPLYWGFMPFTQSYEYMGVLTLLLAALGIYVKRKNSFIKSLIIFSVFLILLSFGRHFEFFYRIFFDYFPYFDKFRVPMMSVTVSFLIIVIFAAHGLDYLFNSNKTFKQEKPLLIILGSFLGLGILLWLLGQSFSFLGQGDSRYNQNIIDLLITIRKEYFNTDLLRFLMLIVISSGVISAFLYKKINAVVMALLLGIIGTIDLINIQNRVEAQYTDVEKLEKQYFKKSSVDKFLLADSALFRILPVGKDFQDNRWGYYHQTIGGYSPIKMYAIEELVEKNIYNGPDKNFPINWNVARLLNVKYLIMQERVENPNMSFVHGDNVSKQIAYKLEDHLPRAFFVDSIEIITDEYERINRINEPTFDPARMAILEEQPKMELQTVDSSKVKVISFSPNQIELNVFTDRQGLLVISEVYFPPGWHIFIDNNETTEIYKTNHAIQSIVVPAGSHSISIKFDPASYKENILYAAGSLSLLYILIISSFITMFIQNKKLKSENMGETP